MEIFVSNPMPADSDINDSTCTLREAIISVNTFVAHNGCPSGDWNSYNTIHLPAGTYKLNSDMVGIYDSMTIVGSGASRTIIDANRLSCFYLSAAATFQDLTITNCGGSAISVPASTSVDVENVSFVNNGGSTTSGSDLRVWGSAWVSGSAFSTTRDPFSGLIRQESGSSVALENSTISGSTAEHGIIYNGGGSLWINNCTIGGNKEIASGIIHLDTGSSLQMAFTTVAYNTSQNNARAISNSGNVSATISSSLIFGNGSPGKPTCTGTITSGGYNVFDGSALCTTKTLTDISTSDPKLDTSSPSFLPRPHGGIGPVYLPLAGSPLLNRVTDGSCYNDQRGAGRINTFCAAGSADVVKVVVMVGNPAAITTGDYIVISQLNSVFGSSSVSVVSDNWAGSPAAGVVVVTGSVNDAHVGTRLRNRSEGIVILKQSLLDEMNMTASSSNEGTTSLTSLYLDGRLPSRSGYTSGGYSSGNNPALTGSSKSYGWGNRSSSTPDVEIMGSVSGTPNHMGFFRYWPGASLYNGDVAENFRIGLFATDSAAAALSGAGSSLLQQAVLGASAVVE